MKIHTRLERDAIEGAARVAGVRFERLNVVGSRSAPRAFDVILSGTSGRRGQGRGSDYQAATWDEWGIFLGALYRCDPSAKAGPYLDEEHFRWSTGDRFDTLERGEQHRRHTWEYRGECVTRSYNVQACQCGAVQRYLAHGVSWSAISGEAEPRPAAPKAGMRERLAALRTEVAQLHRQADDQGLGVYASEGRFEREYRASSRG